MPSFLNGFFFFYTEERNGERQHCMKLIYSSYRFAQDALITFVDRIFFFFFLSFLKFWIKQANLLLKTKNYVKSHRFCMCFGGKRGRNEKKKNNHLHTYRSPCSLHCRGTIYSSNPFPLIKLELWKSVLAVSTNLCFDNSIWDNTRENCKHMNILFSAMIYSVTEPDCNCELS